MHRQRPAPSHRGARTQQRRQRLHWRVGRFAEQLQCRAVVYHLIGVPGGAASERERGPHVGADELVEEAGAGARVRVCVVMEEVEG